MRSQSTTKVRGRGRATLLVLEMLLVLALVATRSPQKGVMASTGGDYALLWWAAGGGGGSSSGGAYGLEGTTGQAESSAAMSGGPYALGGGFWVGTEAASYPTYLPMVFHGP